MGHRFFQLVHHDGMQRLQVVIQLGIKRKFIEFKNLLQIDILQCNSNVSYVLWRNIDGFSHIILADRLKSENSIWYYYKKVPCLARNGLIVCIGGYST